jgi:hypothetical protein
LLPRPLAEVACPVCFGSRQKRCGLARSPAGRRGAHRVHGHRARYPRGGVAGSGSSVDTKRQGFWLKHHRNAADVAGKGIGRRAHRGGGATVGRQRECGAMAVGGGESPEGGRCCPEPLLRLCKSEGEVRLSPNGSNGEERAR